NLGAVAAMAKALRIATENKEENHERMAGYNERVRNAVSVLPSVHVQPGGAPHILNLSFEGAMGEVVVNALGARGIMVSTTSACARSEEHTSELQSRFELVCRLLLVKKNMMIRR